MSQGLILFAHGARDPRWAAPFEAMAALIRRARPSLPLQLAYLDFLQPDLAGAVDALARAGCTRIELVPMFLGSGGHVRQDLPRHVDELRRGHAGLAISLHTTIGEVPEVLQAMADSALQAVDAGAAA